MVERDPIDDLRGLWNRIDAPEPDHCDAEDGARDERADAAIDWMRAAYTRLEAPIPELPWGLRRRRVVRSAAWIAVAAALLATLTIVLANLPRDGAMGGRGDDRVADHITDPIADRVDTDRVDTDRVETDLVETDLVETVSGAASDDTDLGSGDATATDMVGSDPRVVRVLGADDTNDVRTAVDEQGRTVMRRGSVDLMWVAPNESPF